MATCEMKDHIENNNCNRYALNFELLVTLDELDEQYEIVCPDSLNRSSDSQNQDDILEDFCILSAEILLPGTKKEEINDLNNSTSWCREDTSSMQEKEGEKGQNQNDADLSFLDALDIEELCAKLPGIVDIEIVNPSAKPKVKIISWNYNTSWCGEDTSSMQEKEGEKGQNQNDADLFFLYPLDIEEYCAKQPAINDIEIVNPSAKPKVKIISQRTRKVEPSLRILLLKRLASNARYLYALS